MSKLELLFNQINKMRYEWPVGTKLRRIEELRDGKDGSLISQRIINHTTVKEYITYCTHPCKSCTSDGRVFRGSAGDLFCIGIDDRYKNQILYWEEDK